MNNKIVSTKRTSAIFLAIVLVTETIALSPPSFMTNAQAQSSYYIDGIMDNNYKKFKDSSSSKKKYQYKQNKMYQHQHKYQR